MHHTSPSTVVLNLMNACGLFLLQGYGHVLEGSTHRGTLVPLGINILRGHGHLCLVFLAPIPLRIAQGMCTGRLGRRLLEPVSILQGSDVVGGADSIMQPADFEISRAAFGYHTLAPCLCSVWIRKRTCVSTLQCMQEVPIIGVFCRKATP